MKFYPCVLQFHQVSSKSDEKQKRCINSTFFCSEFQSVSRIVKIVHNAFVDAMLGIKKIIIITDDDTMSNFHDSTDTLKF